MAKTDNATVALSDVYAAINPLPAILSAKGKRQPDVRFEVRANAAMTITLDWVKPGTDKDWDRHYRLFSGANFEEVLAKATAFIAELPDADTAQLHDFMGKLGRLIDHARASGIAIDFLNPLTETMKRLSENILTFERRPR